MPTQQWELLKSLLLLGATDTLYILCFYTVYLGAAMSRFPARRRDELRALYRAAPTPEARLLLWEIDRLHEVLIAVDRYLRRMPQSSDQTNELGWSNLMSMMDAEPAIRWNRKLRDRQKEDYLGGSLKTWGMVPRPHTPNTPDQNLGDSKIE